MARKQNKANVRKATQKESGFSRVSSKLKSSMKWLLGLFAGVALTLSLLFIGFWVVGIETSNWFPLNRLEVKGQQYTQAKELYQTFKNIEERGFFSMDMQKAEEEIMTLPWVKNVQLRKVWPETLNVQLTEHQPLAFWGDKGVVSTEGEVFYPNQLPSERWVTLDGPESIASELTELLQMYQEQLAQKELAVSSIALSDRGAVNLKLVDGVEVKLGNYQVAKRLGTFIAQFDNLMSYNQDPLAYVDLRYENGLVAAWGSEKRNSAGVIDGNSNR